MTTRKIHGSQKEIIYDANGITIYADSYGYPQFAAWPAAAQRDAALADPLLTGSARNMVARYKTDDERIAMLAQRGDTAKQMRDNCLSDSDITRVLAAR